MLLRKVKTFKSLPYRSLETSILTFLLLPIFMALLNFFSYKKLLSWLEKTQSDTVQTFNSQNSRDKALSEIDAGFRLGYKYSPVKGSCLARSFVLMTILNRNRIHSKVVIGIRKDDTGFGAHAWLESENDAYGPDSLSRNTFITIS